MRLHLVPWVPRVIQYARVFSKPPKLVPKNDPANRTGKEILYYELWHRFGSGERKKDIVVVLRRLGSGGRLHFYSVRFAKKQNRP